MPRIEIEIERRVRQRLCNEEQVTLNDIHMMLSRIDELKQEVNQYKRREIIEQARRKVRSEIGSRYDSITI